MSASALPVNAADQYILLLPLSSEITYDLDSDYVAEEYSTEDYTILLYEAGEAVEIGITTDLGFVLEDVADGSDFDKYLIDEEGVLSFVMPQKDLCFILNEKAEETEESEETEAAEETEETEETEEIEREIEQETENTEKESEQVSEEASGGMEIILQDGLTANVTMIDGSVKEISGDFQTEEGIDMFEIYSPEEFQTRPALVVRKNGAVMEDLSDFIINQGGRENNYTYDIADSLDPDEAYLMVIAKPPYNEEDEEQTEEAEETIQIKLTEETEQAEETEQEKQMEDGFAVSLSGGLSAEILLVDGTSVSLNTDGRFTGDMEIDLIDVFFETGAYSEDPEISLYKDGEPVEDVSEYILNQNGIEGSYRFDINNIIHYEGAYEFVIVNADAEGEGDAEAAGADSAVSSPVAISSDETVKDGEDFTFRVEIKDGYAITDEFAVMANGAPLEVNPDGSFTIQAVTEDQDITVEGVVKADEHAPVLSSKDETYEGKGNGTITGLGTDMEYSTDGIHYTKVTDPDMEFAAGIYFVRYADQDADGTGEAVEVKIGAGRKITVVFMDDKEIVDAIQISYDESIQESDLPDIPEKEGYDLTKAYWDAESFDNIKEDMIVYAAYPGEEPTISLSSSAGNDYSAGEGSD